MGEIWSKRCEGVGITCCPSRMIICASGRSDAAGELAAGMMLFCSTAIAAMYGPCTSPRARKAAQTAQEPARPAAGSVISTAAITTPLAEITRCGP